MHISFNDFALLVYDLLSKGIAAVQRIERQKAATLFFGNARVDNTQKHTLGQTTRRPT